MGLRLILQSATRGQSSCLAFLYGASMSSICSNHSVPKRWAVHVNVVVLRKALLPLWLKYLAVCVVDAKVSERQTCEHNVKLHLQTTCEVKK